jgi:hypothetical protein
VDTSQTRENDHALVNRSEIMSKETAQTILDTREASPGDKNPVVEAVPRLSRFYLITFEICWNDRPVDRSEVT